MSSSFRRSNTDICEFTIQERISKNNGEIAFRRYSKGRFLGKGGFASVYEIVAQDSSKVSAAKIVEKASLSKPRHRQKLMSEIKIHRALHHPNIVNFEHFFEDSENVYILLELCQNNTLSEMMRRRKRITELEAKCYIAQVVAGLKHLHSHRVIHRDIKLGNLFLTDKMEVKIGDFGLATKLEFEGEKKRTICGTPNYIAPEILEGKQGHGYAVDIWSLGVLLYTFVVGKPPFETNDIKATYRRIKMNAYSFPDRICLTGDVRDLISRVLASDPEQRPNLDEILGHAFFNSPFPKLLPASALAVPPSPTMLKQFQFEKHPVKEPNEPTSPLSPKPKALDNQAVLSKPNTTGENKRTVSVTSYSPKSGAKGPSIWVKKWVDYSGKYGLGYLLSNNCVGAYFNDSTKIVCAPNGQTFQYVQRASNHSGEETNVYSVTEYPQELHKKVTLMEHFRKHLINEESGSVDEFVYIKKGLITSHAIIFRLSNKIIQVCFQDKTEIILCSSSKQVTYVNKRGEVAYCALRLAGDSGNGEMAKRLKYTKEVLTTMLNGGGEEPMSKQ